MEATNRPVRIFLEKTCKNSRFFAGVIIVIFLFSGVFTLRHFGLTWDEGLGNLFFGERYFQFFTSFNQKYLDFNADLESLRSSPLQLFLSPFHNRPNEFPPLADTLSAASMYLFAYRLGWLNPIDGFHLFTILLAATFIWVLFCFAEPRLGSFTALMSILFLGTYPRFWADMHFNVKDVPETIFFSLVIINYWQWFERPGIKRAAGTGILMGCALAVKANAIFIPLILLLSIFPWNMNRKMLENTAAHFKIHLAHYIVMGISTIAIYLASWPYLYADPLSRLKEYWLYIFTQGGRINDQFWNFDALREALTTMPVVMLLACGVGVLLVIKNAMRDKSPLWRLLLFWLSIPILRSSIAGAVNFDGIRHFLEFLPAAALISGYGTSKAVAFMSQKTKISRRATGLVVIALLIANMLSVYTRYYPYLHLYYNEIIGGLSGARDHYLGSEAADYWAISYRQGMDWLNREAPLNSYTQALVAPWILEISAPVFLRSDIQIVSPLPDFDVMEQSQTPYYLMFTLRDGGGNQDEIDYTVKHARLVYQILIDHVPIMVIYQFGGK